MVYGTKVFQLNELNRHRCIATMILWFYLVRKSRDYTLLIITMEQYRLVRCKTLERLLAGVATLMCCKNAYMWWVECKFLYFRYVELLTEVYNLWIHHDKLFYCLKFCGYNCICISLTQLALFLFIKRAYVMHSNNMKCVDKH